MRHALLVLALVGSVDDAAVARTRHGYAAQATLLPAPESLQATATASQLADEGVRLIAVNRLDDAATMFTRARELAVAQGDITVEGRAEWGLGRLAFLRRDHAAADEHYTRATSRLEEAEASDLLTVLALQRGGELFDIGDHAGAEQRWRNGIDAARVKGPRWLHAQFLRSLTFLPTLAVAERLEMIEEADGLLVGENRPSLEGLVAHQHGDLAFVAGDYARALRETERAVPLLERAGARSDLARALTSIGRIYRVHGQPEQAIPYYRRALDVQLGLASTSAAVQSLIGVATSELVIHRHEAAAAAYAQAVDAARVSPEPGDMVLALVQQAAGFVEMQRVADAERSIAAAAALPRDPRQASTLDGVQGMVHFAAGRHADAVLAFDRALADSSGLTMDGRVQVLERRARALDALGRSEEAVAAAQAGIDALERLRTSLVPRDYFKRRFDESWSRLLALSVRRLADTGDARRSLDVAERARARAFADLLASRAVHRTPLLSPLPTNEAPLPTLAGLALRGEGSTTTRGGGESLESTAGVESATLDEMIATARAMQTTIVTYWVDRDVTLAWVISPSGNVSMHRLAIGERALQRAIRATLGAPEPATAPRAGRAEAGRSNGTVGATRVTEAFALGPESRAAFRSLYDAVIAPIRPALPGAGQLLTIVPHGPLFRLSFAALTSRAGRYVIEDYRLAYAPSVAILRLVHDRAARAGGPSFLLIGNPAPAAPLAGAERLDRLPGAAREVDAIRQLVAPAPTRILRDAEATESAMRAAAPSASVLHLATHAIVDDAQPFESFLALAAGPSPGQDDGRLTAEDVYGLWLDADLVVLSACRSASGPVTGDGLLGLTRAFFSAGARSVIATLWDLPDEAARALLPRFYREWLATGDKAEALRRAQVAYIADLRAGRVAVKSPLGTTTLAEHPALWASLILQGRP